MFERLFQKTDGHYDIVRTKSPVFDVEFEETFDSNRLAALLLNITTVERLYRKDARNEVPLDKYLLNHYRYSGGVYSNDYNIKYHQNPQLCGRHRARGYSGQGMVREARACIFDPDYLDCDIANCHPILTRWLCSSFEIDCPKLEQYCSNREQIIRDIIAEANSFGRNDTEVNRDYVKRLFLKASYGAKDVSVNGTRNEFVSDFSKECFEIGSRFAKLLPQFFEDVKEHRNKDYNEIGSFMSHLCQYCENAVLMDMFEILKTKTVHWQKSIFAFDGIMIYKKDFDTFEFIRECEAKILIPGFKLEIKPMADKADLILNAIKYNSSNDYLQEYLSMTHKKLIASFKKFDPLPFGSPAPEDLSLLPEDYRQRHTGHVDLTEFMVQKIWNSLDLAIAYFKCWAPSMIANVASEASHMYFVAITPEDRQVMPLRATPITFWGLDRNGNPKIMKLAYNKFVELHISADLEWFDSVTFIPKDLTNKRVYNSWVGFQAQLVPEVDMSLVQPWLDHLHFSLCDSDPECSEYMLGWLNHAWTKPDVITRKIPLFMSKGEQSAGKGIFVTQFIAGLIYGPQLFATHNGIKWVTEPFNDFLIGTLLHISEELGFVDGTLMNAFSSLKNISADQDITINTKFKSRFRTKHYNNLIMCTNEAHAVRVDQMDSRFVLIKASEGYTESIPGYFDHLAKFLTQGSANHFFTYVTSLPERSIRNSPKTEFYRSVQKLSLSPQLEFLKSFLEDPSNEEFHLNGYPLEYFKNPGGYKPKDMFSVYLEWGKDQNYSSKKLSTYKYFYKTIEDNYKICISHGYKYLCP